MSNDSRAAAKAAMAARVNGTRLIHAYLISGSDEDGRRAAAEYLAKTAVCALGGETPCAHCRHCGKADRGVHPDITFVEREKYARELTVDAIRALRTAAATLPNEAERSVYMLPEGDTMNLQAQNAMLKLLEEPPAHVILILLAENPERLLPTVRSRCEHISLRPVPTEADEEQAEKLLLLWEKCDEMAVLKELIAVSGLDRETFRALLEGMERRIVTRLRKGAAGAAELLDLQRTAAMAEKYLDANVSVGNAAGLLMAGMFRD